MRRACPLRAVVSLTAVAACHVGSGKASATETEPASVAPIDAVDARGAASPGEPSWLVPSLHALGLMTTMRASEAYLWPEPFAETSRFDLGRHYYEAFSKPPRFDSSRPLFEADGDRWQLNVLGHGLFGSELYLRARACGKGAWSALSFTGLSSTAWEYGFEANGVRPSALDLVFTPAAGLVLGEARFFAWSAVRQLPRGAGRSVLSALLDPLGDLERALGTPC